MNSRYKNIDILKNVKGKEYYSSTKYPDIPLSLQDTYVITTVGDRFDILAQQYYNNSSLWWVISIANPQLTQNSYYIPEGTQLRIPSNLSGILSEFENLNN